MSEEYDNKTILDALDQLVPVLATPRREAAPRKESLLKIPTLSIRAPFAWAIVNGHKTIENRTWTTKHRGRILIHASKSCTRDEYDDAASYIEDETDKLPAFEDLQCGGIVGEVNLVDIVAPSPSPEDIGLTDQDLRWWQNDRCHGWVLRDAKPTRFVALAGKQGLFYSSPWST